VTAHDSVRFTLLDQQLVDADGLPVGRVDDLVLELPEGGGPPRVTHLLIGAQALGDRLGGVTGRLMAGTAGRFRSGGDAPARVPWAMLDRTAPLLTLTATPAGPAGVAGLETWLSRHLVGRIPGAGRARL
jgi:hypothetical protein